MKPSKSGLPEPLVNEEPEEGGGAIDGVCETVPDGKYELRYMYYETANYFGYAKVIVHFAIDASDQYAGVEVCRFYNAKKLTGPCKKYGNYVASRCGDLAREYKQLVAEPERMGRISFQILKDKRVLGRLERVTSGYHRKPLALDDHYSRVAELLRIIPDDFGP